nr:MAG TPA: hypothetical protein [Caudoviricetes sp.]
MLKTCLNCSKLPFVHRLFQKSGDTTYCLNDDLPSFLS